LIAAWPRLRDWIEGERDNIVAHQRLTRAASAWFESSRDEADLYRGNKLVAALTWRNEASPSLSAQESEFLDAAEQRARDDLERQRRANRRLKVLAGVSVVAMVAALSATVVAVGRSRDADRRREQVETNQLAAIMEGDDSLTLPQRMRTAAALHARSPTPETVSFLLDTILEAPEIVSVADLDIVAIIGHAPVRGSGGALLVLDANARSTVFDARTLQLARPSLDFSPKLIARHGDQILAVRDDTFEVIDLEDRRALGPAPQLDGEPSSVALSPDGEVLALGYDAQPGSATHIDLINVAEGALVGRVDVDGSTISDLEFGPGVIDTTQVSERTTGVTEFQLGDAAPKLIATVGDDVLELWDVFGEQRLFQTSPVEGTDGAIASSTFSTSGDAIALGRRDGTVEIWREVDGFWRLVTAGRRHRDRVSWVEFDVDDREVVSSALDGSVVLWDALDGSVVSGPIEFESTGELASFFDPAQSGDVITIDSSGTTWKWLPTAIGGGLVQTLPVASSNPPAGDASEWVAVADGEAVVVTGEELTPLGLDRGVIDVINADWGDVAVVYSDHMDWRRDGDTVLSIPVAGAELAGRVGLGGDRIAFLDSGLNQVVVVDRSGSTVDRIAINPSRGKVAGLDLNRSGTDLVYSTSGGELIWYSLDGPEADVLLDRGLGYDGHFVSDGRVVAVGADGVQSIDIDVRPSPVARGFGRGELGVAFGIDASLAATFDAAGLVSLWDIASGRRIGQTFAPLGVESPRWIGFIDRGQLVIGGSSSSAMLPVAPEAWRSFACELADELDPGGGLPPDARLKGLESCP
jgi:WD40 repeat protein